MKQGNIEGKDPINIEGKDPITIDCTNPKGGAIPKIGTKEFNDSAMEMFGGKPKQQTVVELDFTSWRKKNTIMLIKGGWFGNQTPCYVGDARPKTEKEWKELYEQFKKK